MIGFQKKISNERTKRKRAFPSILKPFKKKFIRFVARQNEKLTRPQKIGLIISFAIGITTIQCFNLYQLRQNSSHLILPLPHNISTPTNITLPDSLDIDMIRQYKKMKRKQDSLSSKNKQ